MGITGRECTQFFMKGQEKPKVTFQQRYGRFEEDSCVENISRHIQCGPLGKKFPGRGRKGGELWTGLWWTERRKQSWNEVKEAPDQVAWGRPFKALNEMESH